MPRKRVLIPKILNYAKNHSTFSFTDLYRQYPEHSKQGIRNAVYTLMDEKKIKIIEKKWRSVTLKMV